MNINCDVFQVFTPNMPAGLTFVERESINNNLVDALRTPGKQVIIYGHSGSGKTTVLQRKLEQLYEGHITTQCMGGLTFEQLVLDAFDQLGKFYISESTSSKSRNISASLENEYIGIKANIAGSFSSSEGIKATRILPPQLTPQRLANFLGEIHHCWVLEDFHKMAESEKHKLSDCLKTFMDVARESEYVKIIAIGAVRTARDVVKYDSDMSGRVAEIYVPLMTSDEIKKILEKGKNILNIKFGQSVESDIIDHSNGLALICHELALNTCLNAGINKPLREIKTIENVHFENALKRYVENQSDTLEELFSKAFQRNENQDFDDCRIIIEAIAKTETNQGLTESQILQFIRKKEPFYPEANLSLSLKNLQTIERGAMINYNNASGEYFFLNSIHKVFAKALFYKRDSDNFKFDIKLLSLDQTARSRMFNTISPIIEKLFKILF